ncbi:hypothetical protein SAMN04487939_102230 [Lysobacter sp. yr284]|uniref:hypothetical protein n=1 Tax=Lysobacter sp. yr284 TaxID=1761791 RepID=UPI000894C298|nr:hypothetical protein [Lysobacter sp. yr284]SDY45771.1 hypothetical protein SAMN04487939_102230 [Lysobacter sp. yr284]
MNLPDNALVLPLIMAVSGLPVLVAAVLVARGNLHLINGLDASRLRDPAAVAARFARLLALVAISMFLAALGFYWAHGDYNRVLVVTVLLLVSVNGLAVTMLVALSRLKRDYRAPRDDPRAGRQ